VDAAALWLVWWFVLRFLRRASGGVDHPPVDPEPLPRSRGLAAAGPAMAVVTTRRMTLTNRRIMLRGSSVAGARAFATTWRVGQRRTTNAPNIPIARPSTMTTQNHRARVTGARGRAGITSDAVAIARTRSCILRASASSGLASARSR
jgi:hypothetical protein